MLPLARFTRASQQDCKPLERSNVLAASAGNSRNGSRASSADNASCKLAIYDDVKFSNYCFRKLTRQDLAELEALQVS